MGMPGNNFDGGNFMNLVRYQPWSVFNQLHQELNRLFDTDGDLSVGTGSSALVAPQWAPAVDIKEEANRYVIYADLPGVAMNDVEVTLEKGVLTLKGERSSETKEEGDGYVRVERTRGSFYRRFSLPESADAERVQAKGKDGVLEIVIPKREQELPRKVAVQA